jgi:hypothetical protein
LKRLRTRGPLAMSGFRTVPLFSRVGPFLLTCLLSVPDILLGVHGRLEGESIAGASIQDTANLLYFEESPLPPAPRRARSSQSQYSSSPASPFLPASPRNFTVGEPIQDWREPIRRMLQPLNVSINIRITALPGDTNPSPSDSPAT